MKWLNWPPARGPKPPELERKIEYEFLGVSVGTFPFRQPRSAKEERRLLVEAALDIKYRELGGKDKHPTIEWIRPKETAARPLSKFSADVDYPVQATAKLDFDSANEFVQGICRGVAIREIALKAVTIDLTYPLSTGVRMKLRPFTVTESWGDDHDNDTYYRAMSVGYILWMVARQYEIIYENWKKYGVWGHAFDELRFKSLKVGRGRCKIDIQAE